MQINIEKRYWIFIGCILLLLCINRSPADAQILRDTASVNLIKKGVANIYNMQFDEANKVYTTISQSYPGHPVVYLYKGLMTYWENYPLLPSSPARASYEKDMHKCIELCEKNKEPVYEAENLLANVCSRGLLLLFYADNDLSGEVTPLATSTYHYVRRSFDFTSICPDFFYFTGIYNYYREAYPRAHPVYKTLAFLFPAGDMEKGLRELQTAAESSIVMRAESYSILSWIMVHFENKYNEASYYSKCLCEQYPANMLFKAMYIKNLLLMKEYDEAERLIKQTSEEEKNPFYQVQLSIFNGIIQEKKYHNNVLAGEYYEKGIDDISAFGAYGDDFAAYAYFGLSRISDAKGDKHGRRLYHRKAMDLVDFKKINFDD